MLKRYSLFVFLLLSSITTFAQLGTGTIKGFVYDKSNGEPMITTLVFIEGTNYGVQTDINGYFSFPKIPVGEYTLTTTQQGYDTAKVSVVVNENQVVSHKLYLRTTAIRFKEVTVSAGKIARKTTVNTGVTTISQADIKKLPGQGGEPDIAQFLQMVPGVTFTGDQGGQLYIRGGAPSQTGILLDGVTIYNPFHTIGLFSVFETDAIRSADVQSAGFGAQYGNRTSAILDIHTKDGNKNRTAGKISVSPIMARAMLEGPLVKAKTEDGTSVTYLLSFKHSYLDKTSKSLYSGLGGAFKNGLPYSFTDFYGKVSVSGGSGSKLNVFGFNFNDQAQFLKPNSSVSQADFDWTASGGGATFVVSPTGSSTLISGKFAYSKYDINYKTATEIPRGSSINGFEGGIEFTNFFPGYTQLKYGLEVSGLHTTLDYHTANNSPITLDRNNTIAGLYVSVRKNVKERFIIEPAIRFQYYASLNKVSPEPRVGMKYNINKNLRIKAAAGVYSQTIVSTKSDRDIVNFFTGFLLSPDQQIRDEDGNIVTTNLQTAYHVLGGIELDVQELEFNLEPWYKKFGRTIELNRTKEKTTDPDYQAGYGDAYGIDLGVKYVKNRFYFWGNVSYQKVTNTYLVGSGARDANNNEILTKQTFPTPFDRRLNINMLGSYTMGKKKLFEVSVRYNFGSPFPFTQTQGFYENVNMTGNGIGGNYLNQNGQLGLVYANDINGGRLSNYHRLDLSAKKKFRLTTYSNIEATFSVTNVMDRKNIFYVDRIENTRVYQLPVFPSLSATWNF